MSIQPKQPPFKCTWTDFEYLHWVDTKKYLLSCKNFYLIIFQKKIKTKVSKVNVGTSVAVVWF